MDYKVNILAPDEALPEGYVLHSIYESQLEELAEVRFPAASPSELPDIIKKLSLQNPATRVVYSWKSTVLETLPEDTFMELKTNRNQLLIKAEEQHQLYASAASIAGMSVGSSILYGLVGTGFSKNLTIADDDVFSTSNLNRVPATVFDVGQSKAETATKRSLEMNPFLDIQQLGRIDDSNLGLFVKKGETSIVFEEIDDFRMKVRIREAAKEARVPLVMLTNLGDSVMIDIERYDLDHSTELFNGNVPQDLIDKIKATDKVDLELMRELSVRLVDRQMIPERAMESLAQMSKTLVGRPQLYSTVALDGGIAPFLMKHILLESDTRIESGRYKLALDSAVSS